MNVKSSHHTRGASQTRGHKSPIKKKAGKTKSVKKDKFSLKLIGFRSKPQKANNTATTHPKGNQKTTDDITKKDAAESKDQSFDPQTYEDFLLYKKFRQERKLQSSQEKNDEQIPAVDEECESCQVEEEQHEPCQVEESTKVSDGYDKNEYSSSQRIQNNYTVSLDLCCVDILL